MSIPDRKSVIEQVLVRFGDRIEAPGEQIDGIGRRLLPHFIEAMPADERPQWGVLRKSTGTFPYDILVWKPTREHVDVLTSHEAEGRPGFRRLRGTWGNVGVLPRPDWTWCDWRASTITPLEEMSGPEAPDVPPVVVPPPSTDLERRLRALEERVNRHLKE